MAKIINETNIQFKSTLSNRKATRRIVIHHAASSFTTTWQDIHQWHLKNGWAGIGYHYVIHANGGIYRGRPEDKAGAHAYQDAKHEANSDGIGICLVGNFMLTQPATPPVGFVGGACSGHLDKVSRHPGDRSQRRNGDILPWGEVPMGRVKIKIGGW